MNRRTRVFEMTMEMSLVDENGGGCCHVISRDHVIGKKILLIVPFSN